MAEEPIVGGEGKAEAKPAEGEGRKLYEWTHQVPAELIDEDMHDKPKIADYVKLSRTRRDELKTANERLKAAVFKPGKDAKPEEVAAWNKAKGVPDKPEDYDFGDAKILDEEGAKAFRAFAHQNKISAEDAKAFAQFQAQRSRAVAEQRAAEVAKTREATMTVIKTAYPGDWEARVTQANRIAGQFFGETAMAQIAESGLGDKDWFVKGMIEISKHFTEGGVPKGEGAAVVGETMQDRIDARYPSMKKYDK